MQSKFPLNENTPVCAVGVDLKALSRKGRLSVTNRAKLTRITNTAAKIIGLPTPNLIELNNKSITRLANTIAQDITHPLNQYIIPLPSGRRYRTIKFRRVRLGKSLIPAAIAALNSRPC